MERIDRHLVLAALLLCGSCAMMSAGKPEALPDGTYRVACDKSLAECLAPFDKCRHGFDVVRATESRHRRGPEPLPAESVDSEAILRCRNQSGLLGGQPTNTGGAAPSTNADGGTTTGCFPGATQPCLGPAACKGAQVCVPGGTAFGACDCGQLPPAPAPPAETPPPASQPAPPTVVPPARTPP